MRNFTPAELESFLVAVDEHLRSPAKVVIVGGGAIALHGVARSTTDIETVDRISRSLKVAAAQARQETQLPVPLEHCSVADVPYNSDERVIRVMPELSKLQVYVLEPHDLAISKAFRGIGKDMAAIKKLHEVSPLDEETLIRRYLDETDHVVGSPWKHDQNFALMIHHLFGAEESERVLELVKARRGG